MSLKTTGLLVVLFVAFGSNAYLYYKLDKKEKESVPVVTVTEVAKPVVMRTEGGTLFVSSMEATHELSRSVIHTVLGVEAAKTEAKVKVPVVYKYEIELAREWTFLRRGNVVAVIAPAVRPSLPVAIDTSKLTSSTKGLVAFAHREEEINTLQRTISPTLEQYAKSPTYISHQREAARKTVAEFVRKWILKQPEWKNDDKVVVKVFFADESLMTMMKEGFAPVALQDVGESNSAQKQ